MFKWHETIEEALTLVRELIEALRENTEALRSKDRV